LQRKGYNIKHEIIGLMTKINPKSNVCNCEIACVTKNSPVFVYAKPDEDDKSQFVGVNKNQNNSSYTYRVEPTIEYGQCDHFVAIDPETGEVLLPKPEFLDDKEESE